jgi:hypothetical protein
MRSAIWCPNDKSSDATGNRTMNDPNLTAQLDGIPGVVCSAWLADYPANWQEIAGRIKSSAEWKCERCKHPHDVTTGHVLTVHHLDGQKGNCADWNLAALCQRCHLAIQGRVKMEQLFFTEILDVSEWFKPHLEGYLRSKSANDPSSGAAGRKTMNDQASNGTTPSGSPPPPAAQC